MTTMQAHAGALLDQHRQLAEMLRRRETPPLDEFDTVLSSIRQHNDGLAEAEQARLEWLADRGANDTDTALASAPEQTRATWAALQDTARRFHELSQGNLMALRRVDRFLGERIDFLLQGDRTTGLYTAEGGQRQPGGPGRTLGDA